MGDIHSMMKYINYNGSCRQARQCIGHYGPRMYYKKAKQAIVTADWPCCPSLASPAVYEEKANLKHRCEILKERVRSISVTQRRQAPNKAKEIPYVWRHPMKGAQYWAINTPRNPIIHAIGPVIHSVAIIMFTCSSTS